MGITYDFKCDKCGNETYLEAENEYEKVLICEKCAECYLIEQKQPRVPVIPRCPTCQSTNIKKLDIIDRGISVGIWGTASNKFNKTFKCKNCGYTW